jgi:hypothetical protein
MTTIIQPKIHTRVRLWFRSGRKVVFDLPYETNSPPNGTMTDANGKLHGINADAVEDYELEHFNAEVGLHDSA